MSSQKNKFVDQETINSLQTVKSSNWIAETDPQQSIEVVTNHAVCIYFVNGFSNLANAFYNCFFFKKIEIQA